MTKIPLAGARSVLSLVARQLCCGEITLHQASNHVTDYRVMVGRDHEDELEAFYEGEILRYRAGKPFVVTPPIPMRLRCEGCGELHIDEDEFASKPHHTHACQSCGHVWRPAVVATVGVRFLPGFKNEKGTKDAK